jgi:hypothetical protein
VQEPWASGISCLNRLLGAEHDHLPACGQLCQGVCKGSKVGNTGAENLVAPALGDVVAFASKVALHRGEAFRIRQLISVNVADRADDVAKQLGFIRPGLFQEARGLVIDVERFEQIGVAV